MNKLELARNDINAADKQIIKAFEKRMEAVKEVSKFKIKNKLPITDLKREKELLKKNLSLFTNKEFKKYYSFIFEGFLKASKQMQKDKNK